MSISVGESQNEVHVTSFPIPICKTINEADKVFNENKKVGLPFFAIRQDNGFSFIEIDFVNIGYDLKIEALNKVIDIFQKIVSESKVNVNTLIFTAGTTLCIGPQTKQDICLKYAPILQQIIFNKQNWKSCYTF
jgi:hypothetical protein